LDLAVAVASGTACLRRFPVARPGRVLMFAAEDALHVVTGSLPDPDLAAFGGPARDSTPAIQFPVPVPHLSYSAPEAERKHNLE
jgi:hypothetical protein